MVSLKDVLIAMHEKELPLPKTLQSKVTFQEVKKCHWFLGVGGGEDVPKIHIRKTFQITHYVNVCIR